MKILWFHLMPYTELPDSFKEDHPSVWVDIDSRLFEPEKAHGMYNDFMDELEFAAEIGFDGVCVNEHHQNAYGLMPSPNLIAATLARRTRDTALVVMGNSLALYPGRTPCRPAPAGSPAPAPRCRPAPARSGSGTAPA